MSFIGADPEQLTALAQRFVNASQSLNNIRGGITNSLLSTQWDGSEADRFRSDWSSQLAPSIARAATSLDACSSYLKTKAVEQVEASAVGAEGVNLSAALAALLKSPAFINAETGVGLLLGMLGISNPVLSADQRMIQGEMGQSPAQQAAWWNSLSPAVQNQLETLAPASLLMLTGLPAGVRQQVSSNLANGLDSSIPVKQTTISVSAQGGEVIVGGGNVQFVQTTNADGSVTVALSGKVFGGVGVQWNGDGPSASVSATLGAGDSATYTFANLQQAQAFEHGLIQSATPQLGWQDLGYAMPGVGAASVLTSQVASYLSGYGSNLTSNVVSGSLTDNASVSVGAPGFTDGASVSIQAGTTISHDTVQGTTTATLSASGSGYGQIAPFAGAASSNISAAVTWDSKNQLSSLTLTGQYSADGTYTDAPGALSTVSLPPELSGSGTAGRFQMQVDLTNPQNVAAAASLIHDIQTHDASGAAAAYQQLYNNSTVTVEKGNPSGSQGGVGFGVGSASYSDTNVDYTNIYVKPPNGDYVSVKPQ